MDWRVPRILAAALLAVGMAASSGAQAATISFADAMTVLARDCGADVQKHCKGLNLGNNAIGECLVQHQSEVSPVCITTLAAVRASLQQRLAALAEVLKVCRGDAARRCQGVVQTDAHVLDCLLKAERRVSNRCNVAITDAGWR